MITRNDRLIACYEDPNENWGAWCRDCQGAGWAWKKRKWFNLPPEGPPREPCSTCAMTGKDPIPWAELMLGGRS